MKTIEEVNGDITLYLQDVLANMNSKDKVELNLRYLDVSYILTAVKALEYSHKTFEELMKIDFKKMRLNAGKANEK